jgi:hypothetical protein
VADPASDSRAVVVPALITNLLFVMVAAVPVNVGAATVPAGVPPVTALVVADDPVKVSAGTVPAEPLNVGGLTGHEIAPSAKPPPEFDPAGVPALTALVLWAAVPVNA